MIGLQSAQGEPFAGLDVHADEFEQTRVVGLQASEKEQRRIAAAPFEFVADLRTFCQSRGEGEANIQAPLLQSSIRLVLSATE
jgi:hypothetical protein